MKREENNERFLVAKHYFEPIYGSIVKKGCKDGLFRVEYHIKKVWDNSIYHDDNGNFLDEPIHNFRDEKVFHIIHDATETEVPFVQGYSAHQPDFSLVLQNLVAYGVKVGTLKFDAVE
jgi:hypothetical protein